MNQNKQTIKYFLYVRKSSESEDRQVASIDSQIRELTKIASINNLEIIQTFSESQSAKRPGRPVFNEMIEKIHNNKANGIICWSLDRLARNPVDGGNINWMVQQGIIQHIKTNGRDYYPSDNVLMMSVEFGMANQFLRDLSDNTKRGLKTKAERGWYPTYTTLGYKHNPLKQKGEKEIIKDPERFHLVRKMFDLMLSGKYSLPQILNIANNEWNLRTKKGNKVARSAIYRIFEDPFYYGTFEYPKNSGNWYQGKHDPMITEEEYNKIQTLLRNKKGSYSKKYEFPFRGPIRCGECGAMITAEEKIKKQKNGNVHRYVYYHCTKRKNPACSQGCIEEKELKEQIERKIQKVEIPPEFHAWAIKWLKNHIKEESNDRNQIISRIKKDYENCLKEIDGIISMRARQELDEENYKRKMETLKQEKARLQELVTDVDDRMNKQIERIEKAFDFARDAKKEFETGDPEKQKSILMDLGSNLLLKDRILTISIEKPLLQIERVVPEVKAIHGNVRTSENSENKAKLEELYEKSPILLRG